jgi:DNA-binding NarL/FixJ family response regulator
MSKSFIALFDEQKLVKCFFQHNLEKFHKYDVLFGCSSEKELFMNLNAAVKLLLIHVPDVNENMIRIMQKVLRNFREIKILAYSPSPEILQSQLSGFMDRTIVISVLDGSKDFFDAMQALLPDHPNHAEGSEQRREYNLGGFEKIKQNRKWVLIIKSLSEGMRPKEMESITGLKWNTINSYIEQMQKCTGCRNQTELFWQAKQKGIL